MNIGRGFHSPIIYYVDDATWSTSRCSKSPVVVFVNDMLDLVKSHLSLNNHSGAQGWSNLTDFYNCNHFSTEKIFNRFRWETLNPEAVNGARILICFPDNEDDIKDMKIELAISLQEVALRLQALDSSSLDDLLKINETGTFDHLGQKRK